MHRVQGRREVKVPSTAAEPSVGEQRGGGKRSRSELLLLLLLGRSVESTEEEGGRSGHAGRGLGLGGDGGNLELILQNLSLEKSLDNSA